MFNIGTAEISNDYEVIPRGLYPAFVEKVEFKQSKAGAEYMNVTFKIFGEKYANRIVWNIYNVMHAKEQVRNIAFGDLKKMFIASGFKEDALTFTSKEELAEAVSAVRCMIKLDVKTDDYGTKNTIKGYQELDENLEKNSFDATNIPF